MENGIGFKSERKRKKGPYEDYFEKWVRVHSDQGNLYMGKLSKIEDELLVLSPHLGVRSNPKYGSIRKIFYTKLGESIPLPRVSSVEPSSKLDLLNHAKFMNDLQIKSVEKEN